MVNKFLVSSHLKNKTLGDGLKISTYTEDFGIFIMLEVVLTTYCPTKSVFPPNRYLSVTDDNFFGDTPFGEITDREILRDDSGILRENPQEENSVIDPEDVNNSTKGDATLTIDQSNLGAWFIEMFYCPKSR